MSKMNIIGVRWFNSLPEDEQNKMVFLYSVVNYHRRLRESKLMREYTFRRQLIPYTYRDYKTLVIENLRTSVDELINLPLKQKWVGVSANLSLSIEQIKTGGFNTWEYESIFGVFQYVLLDSGLASQYFKQDIVIDVLNPSSLDINTLGGFNEVIDFMTLYNWILFLVYTLETKTYNEEINSQEEGLTFGGLTFRQLFRPEFRDRVPDEVLYLLGPERAGAWTMGPDHKRQWCYEGPENSVITPFYILVGSDFIDIKPRGKRSYIQTWLREFGVEYKPKTFDSGSRGVTYEYFNDYLSRIKK